jgi:hypothetical protein
MRVILSAVVCVFLFTPTTTSANDITFVISDGGELPASFGLTAFTVSSPVESAWGDAPLYIPLVDTSFDSMNLVSGPLLGMEIDPALNRTIYTYGPGTLTIDASWFAPDGTLMSGSFAAVIDGFQLFVCEGCDTLFGGSDADDLFITLGPGVFDTALAHQLGVARRTTGGEFSIGLEDIDGDPGSQERIGFSHSGNATLLIPVTIPEPTTISLFGVALTVMVVRRQRGHRERNSNRTRSEAS